MTDPIGAQDVIVHRQARNLIRNSHLFKGLPEEEIDRLAALFKIENLDPGERLFSQGDAGESFFFVFTGSIMITREMGIQEELLSTMTKGDFFGEGSLLFGNSRRASATAVEATAVLRMDREDFNNLLADHPAIR